MTWPPPQLTRSKLRVLGTSCVRDGIRVGFEPTLGGCEPRVLWPPPGLLVEGWGKGWCDPLTLLSVAQLHFTLLYTLGFHLDKSSFCLKTKFSRPGLCGSSVPQPATALEGGSAGGGERPGRLGLPGGGCRLLWATVSSPLTPAVLLLQPENAPGLSSC